jgi:DNA helicase II / ATP-dependent DNA helicase PcrA
MAGRRRAPDPSEVFAASPSACLRALAGPGTGKTFALIRRLTRLLDDGVAARRILVVTFARTAARDLVAAVARLGEAAAEELVPRTLHSYCFSVLGRERVLQATGRVPRIALEFERTLLLADLEGPLGTLTDRRKLVLAFEAAWARLQSEDPGQPVAGLDQAFQDALLRSLRWHRAMLVGEVVPVALSYLRNNPQADELTAFDHVLVDEYQDLNRAEQVVLDLLSENGSLAVIGDDDQSIYSFKSANPEGIREFADDHPGTRDVEFLICRRCPHRVVEMAQTLIQRNPGRVRGPLAARRVNPQGEIHHVQWRSPADEADGLARFIVTNIEEGIDAGKCLVLANVRQIGYGIRDAIRIAGVECNSFFREEAVGSETAQEAVTLLTLLARPNDRLALRAWLAIGSSTQRRPAYQRLLAAARANDVDVWEILRRLDAGETRIPYTTSALDRWRELRDALAALEPLREDLEAVVDEILPEGDAELALLREAATPALEDADGVADLADAVRYGVSQREVPLEAAEVRVMSMHASKGLTADLVVLAGLVDGVIPRVDARLSEDEQQTQREEQRRLFFVAMTRTTNILVFSSYSQLEAAIAHRLQARVGRWVGGGSFRTFASSFLGELGDECPDAIRGEDWEY